MRSLSSDGQGYVVLPELFVEIEGELSAVVFIYSAGLVEFGIALSVYDVIFSRGFVIDIQVESLDLLGTGRMEE